MTGANLGASSTTPRQDGLRFAVATDGDMRHWQACCVEELAAVAGVSIVRWVRGAERSGDARRQRSSGALAIVPVPEQLQSLGHDDGLLVPAADASAGTVDILLDLTDRGLSAPIESASEVWRFRYGRELSEDPALVALRDYVRGPGVTRAALVSRPSGAIVREGWLRTLSWWKGAPLDSLLMDTTGWPAAAAFERLQHRAARLDPPSVAERQAARFTVPPRRLLTVAAIARRALGATNSLAGRDGWNIGYLDVPIQAVVTPQPNLDIHWLPVRPEHYAADPFGLERGGVVHIFFEDFDQTTGIGTICHLGLSHDGKVSTVESILNPGVHASYPYLVERDGCVYMLPETSAAAELVLYEAHDFPYDWRPVATLLSGIPILDASVIEHDGRWWMFATRNDRGGNQNLLIWHAPDLFGPWTPHAGNPVKTDARSARPGGTPFVAAGQLYRPSQDDSRVYGGRVVLNRVDVLTHTAFAETSVRTIDPREGSAYPDGLHTLSAAGPYTLVDGNRRQRTWRRFARNLAGRVSPGGARR